MRRSRVRPARPDLLLLRSPQHVALYSRNPQWWPTRLDAAVSWYCSTCKGLVRCGDDPHVEPVAAAGVALGATLAALSGCVPEHAAGA